ncbi:hypothetical protein THAOC_37435 [Thalassiosira oceanica]|uniref:Helicase ATP-binding domain-containing protein n=1 Tax=Thalassiosira oceanica TaxID=159749 RepID=K0QYD7_THAOC|nr:hypothetical protein THAOC_37435 [Thalassiosira oceanica]|eukprot:EJK44058.1 hypothetical protein THAOC_37435 [Thalassiosira oceanica]
MLLGSELAYRMFDAEWSIRHGALLGTLAILRAWRVHDSNQVFGTWPNDCLARCLCILVLDQFTDFGEDIAVAPIRETAAQIIAVLLETAPSDIRRKSFDVLVHLYSRGQTRPGCAGWEIRQGVLLTWRYIMALKERDNHTRRKLRCIPQQEENLEAEKTILNLSIRSLIDPNDDNKAISAQILARAFKCNYPLSDEDKKDCYLNVWVSMETLREGVSSCAADLLSLLACILTKDLHSFVGCMQGKSVDSIELILRKIVGLESDPSNSIRTSSYTAHSLIVVPVTKLYASKQKQPVKLADFFCQVLVGIFETHFSAGEHGDDLSSARGQAWSATLESLLLVAGDTTDKLVSRTVGNLILRHLAAVNGSVVVGKFGSEQEYRSRLSTSMALSEIFEKLLPDETISTFVQALAVVIDSPYPFQAEFSCTLLTSVASCIPQEILYKINESLEIPPSCVRLFGNVQYSSFLDDSMIRVICNKGLAMLFDTSVNFTQHDMRSMWRSVFIKKGIDLGALPSCSTDTSGSVRIASSLAGIIVSSHCRLRAITPVARALVTSLNNEDSCARMIETSRFTSSLVIDLSSDVVSHKKAKDKLIENVCSAACNQSKSQSSLGGQIAIKMMIKNLESFQGLETLGPLYLRISPLAANHSISGGQTASQALIILHTITEAISKGSSFDAIVEMLPAVVNVACSSSSNDLGSRSTLSIKNLCRIDLALTMDKMLPSLLSALSDMADDDKRVGGCRLLSSVLTEFEVRMAKYVLSLLPTAMRLMTDPKEECSRLATNAFAILVRVAPLSAEYIDDKDIHQTNNVVQHLILGKPLPPVVLPEVLKYELATSGVNLRPYQEEGISWLKFLAEVGLNGALCDDMGLGKTLQALVAIAASNFNGSSKSLIVAPSSVVGHWHSELIKYFPSGKIFKPIKYTGSKRKRLHFQDGNVIVTSYSILRSDIDILTDTVWNYVVLDEGHLLKNTKTATAKASRRLKAEHKLILTGTPLQNSVNEIWASFDFLMPNFLGNSSEFTREFSKPVMKAMSPEASAEDIASGMDALKILHQTTLPFILRRTKAQVLQDLPPKIISDIPCALSGQQRPLYEMALASSGTKEALQFVDNCLSDGGQADSSLSARPPGSDVLTSLIRLRLICTHPLLGSDESSLRSCGHTIALSRLDCSGKLQALNDLLRQAGIAEPEMAAADNDETGYAVLDHYCNGDELEDDPTELLDFHAEDQQRLSNTARADRSKCLIFCQFSQSLDILERLLFEAHMPTLQYLRLDGSVPANRRNEVAQEFNSDPAVRVLLLSTKVGSLGLNLCGQFMPRIACAVQP